MSTRGFLLALLALVISIPGPPSASAVALRNVWDSGVVYSRLARAILDEWRRCRAKTVFHQFKNWGMGGELHMFSQALCNAFGVNATLLQLNQTWAWNDQSFCRGQELQPLRCYFQIENHCPHNVNEKQDIINWKNDWENCRQWIWDESSRTAFRSAVMEILFANISAALINETRVAAAGLFQSMSEIPSDLITVHIRSGDKAREMKLISEHNFVQTIEQLVETRQIAVPHIYVVTESTSAWRRFQNLVARDHSTWRVYKYLPDNTTEIGMEHFPIHAAFVSGGAVGKASMIALLLALEARHYILTTGSNWSRVIDELRRRIVDVQCQYCTHMTDLNSQNKYGNWR